MDKKKPKQVKTFRKPRPKRARGKHKMYDAQAVAVVERRFQIVNMRRDGWTLADIAKELKLSIPTVSKDLKTVVNETLIVSAETADENRQIQIERLDQLIRTYTQYATQSHKEVRIDAATKQEFIAEVPPDPKYANLILAVEARRAKLLALDIPEVKKMEVSGIRLYEGVDLSQV